MARRGHRAFAALWDFATRHEGKAERRLRQEACASAVGRVLELGAGVGANWEYLDPAIDYVGIEPDPFMRERAGRRAADSGHAWRLEAAVAERLPFADESFDTVLSTLTLCTVRDQAKALAEARRVLKPGGTLVFVEHVRPHGRVGSALADAVKPAWRRMAAGCEPNRRTEEAIRAAGLEVDHVTRQRVNGLPMIAGVATRPG